MRALTAAAAVVLLAALAGYLIGDQTGQEKGAAAFAARPTPTPTEDPRAAALQSERDELERRVQTLELEAAKAPTFVMWDVRTTLPGGRQTTLGLPDTFTVRIQFTATAPVRARIMSFDQYVRYMTTAKTDALTYPATKSLDVTFHDAEGCAAYILVLDAEQEAVVTPNVTITRVPPDRGYTGVCAR